MCALNRLIKSSGLNAEERRETARAMAQRLAPAKAPVVVFLPSQGIEEWDKPGEPAHDPEAQAAFFDEMRQQFAADRYSHIALSDIDCHINDTAFSEAVLRQLDAWIADGIVKVW